MELVSPPPARLTETPTVNNAARFVFGKIEEVTGEQWTACLSTNIKGYAFVIKAALPSLVGNV